MPTQPSQTPKSKMQDLQQKARDLIALQTRNRAMITRLAIRPPPSSQTPTQNTPDFAQTARDLIAIQTRNRASLNALAEANLLRPSAAPSKAKKEWRAFLKTTRICAGCGDFHTEQSTLPPHTQAIVRRARTLGAHSILRAIRIHQCALRHSMADAFAHGSIFSLLRGLQTLQSWTGLPSATASEEEWRAFLHLRHICADCAPFHPWVPEEGRERVLDERSTLAADPSASPNGSTVPLPSHRTPSEIDVWMNSKIDATPYVEPDPEPRQRRSRDRRAAPLEPEQPGMEKMHSYRGIDKPVPVIDYLCLPPQKTRYRVQPEDFVLSELDPRLDPRKKSLTKHGAIDDRQCAEDGDERPPEAGDLGRKKVPYLRAKEHAVEYRLRVPGERKPWEALDTQVRRAHEEFAREGAPSPVSTRSGSSCTFGRGGVESGDEVEMKVEREIGDDHETEDEGSSWPRRMQIAQLTGHRRDYLRNWSKRNSALQGAKHGAQHPLPTHSTLVSNVSQSGAIDYLISAEAPTTWPRRLADNWPKDPTTPSEKEAKSKMGGLLSMFAQQDKEAAKVLAQMPKKASKDDVGGGEEVDVLDFAEPDELESMFEKPNVRIGAHDPDEVEYYEAKRAKRRLELEQFKRVANVRQRVPDDLIAWAPDAEDLGELREAVEARMERAKWKLIRSGKLVPPNPPRRGRRNSLDIDVVDSHDVNAARLSPGSGLMTPRLSEEGENRRRASTDDVPDTHSNDDLAAMGLGSDSSRGSRKRKATTQHDTRDAKAGRLAPGPEQHVTGGEASQGLQSTTAPAPTQPPTEAATIRSRSGREIREPARLKD